MLDNMHFSTSSNHRKSQCLECALALTRRLKEGREGRKEGRKEGGRDREGNRGRGKVNGREMERNKE